MSSKQLDYEVRELMKKHPKKFWAIYLGCMHTARSLKEIKETFDFSGTSLYQYGLIEKMVALNILKAHPTDNRKTKLYDSQIDWRFPKRRYKELNRLLQEENVKKAFNLNLFKIEKSVLKERAEDVFFCIVSIIQACYFFPNHKVIDQLIHTMLPHFLKDSGIDTHVMAIMKLRSEGK